MNKKDVVGRKVSPAGNDTNELSSNIYNIKNLHSIEMYNDK